jgi:hypothetical protein
MRTSGAILADALEIDGCCSATGLGLLSEVHSAGTMKGTQEFKKQRRSPIPFKRPDGKTTPSWPRR